MQNNFNVFYETDTFRSQEGDSAYDKFLTFWRTKKNEPINKTDANTQNLQTQIILEKFAQNEKVVKIVLDQTQFKILYTTDNIEELLGYTSTEFLKYNMALCFRCLTFKHIGFILKISKKGFEVHNKIGHKDYVQNLSIIACGVKVKKKNQKEIQILIKYAPSEFDENGFVKTALVTLEDVTHLLKSDFYWVRWCFGENREFKFQFLSHKKTDLKQDIISDREKDVLRLIAQGLDSQVIGNQLNISKGTVDNHRKNMIARTGVRDTTALVQVALSCGII